MNSKQGWRFTLVVLLAIGLALPAVAQDTGTLDKESAERVHPAKRPGTVQFLPAYNALVEEALAESRETLYERTPTRVIRPEHLAAIMVQTGRDKDRQRFSTFLTEAEMDGEYLQGALRRYGLESRWKEWTR